MINYQLFSLQVSLVPCFLDTTQAVEFRLFLSGWMKTALAACLLRCLPLPGTEKIECQQVFLTFRSIANKYCSYIFSKNCKLQLQKQHNILYIIRIYKNFIRLDYEIDQVHKFMLKFWALFLAHQLKGRLGMMKSSFKMLMHPATEQKL